MRGSGLLAAAAIAAGVVVASSGRPASAQPPPAPPPAPAPGDLGGSSGALLTTPLRLSLEGSVPSLAHAFPNCATREDDAGNSTGGVPIEHHFEWRLAPRLTLGGFAQLGCPIDAGIGGAVTYALPLGRALQLVLGAGFYVAPGQLPFFGGPQPSPSQLVTNLASAAVRGMSGSSPAQGAARIDLVVDTASVGPLHLGVESNGPARRAIKLGGGF